MAKRKGTISRKSRVRSARMKPKPGNMSTGTGTFAPDSSETRRFRKECGLAPVGKYAGEVVCLKCDKKFQSPDRRNIRICDRCKGTKDWKQGGSLRGGELHAGRPDALPQSIKYESQDGGKAHRARLSRTFLKKNKTSAEKAQKRLDAILKEENEFSALGEENR